MRHHTIAGLLLLASFQATFCSAQSLPELHAVYERATIKIEWTYRTDIKSALDAYGKGLPPAEKALTRAGDLDGVMATRAEIARFENERTVPKEIRQALPEQIEALRARYMDTLDAVTAKRDARMVDLIRRYQPPLDALKRQLMLADRMEEAKAVADELKRVTVELAETESRLPASDTTRDGRGRTDMRPSSKRLLPGALTKGLVLRYDFERDEGEKVTDRSGKKNHGTVRGGTWAQNARGLRNGAYRFDSADEAIDIGGGVKPPLPMAVMAWVKAESLGRPIQIFMNDEWNSKQYAGIVVGLGGSEGRLQVRMGGGSVNPAGRRYVNASEGSMTAGKWHHLAAVFEGHDKIGLFLDGERVVETYSGGGWQLKYSDDSGRVGGFQGSIDEVMVYDRAPSDAEIQKIYTLQGGK